MSANHIVPVLLVTSDVWKKKKNEHTSVVFMGNTDIPCFRNFGWMPPFLSQELQYRAIFGVSFLLGNLDWQNSINKYTKLNII